MKKLFVLLGILLLCGGLLAYSLYQPKIQTPLPTSEPTEAEETTQPPPVGQVRFVNEDPSMQGAWEALAAEFTKQTGFAVTVIGDGVDPATVDAPTLFTLTDGDDLSRWEPVCLDLSCTEGYSQLASWDLALRIGGKVCGIPLESQAFGLVYNTALLAQAGYTRADISNFADLKTVVQAITANREELGAAAFAAMNIPNDDIVAHFVGLSGDPRDFWDLYMQNSTQITRGDGLSDFLSGKAVFYPASTGDYEKLSAMEDHKLGFLPLYSGGENAENGILHMEARRYFCVRADAEQQDVDAALAFLSYLVHPREDGTVPLDDLGIFAPYRQTTYAGNKLEALLREELASGRACRNCASIAVPNGLILALATYTAEPTDENWAKVMELM